MEAKIGDRMVVAGATLGSPVRDGQILEVRGKQGSPPYLIRWSDTGRDSLFLPGPDSHVDHFGEDDTATDTAASTTRGHTNEGSGESSTAAGRTHPTGPVHSTSEHVTHWQVDIYLFEDPDLTTAQAVLWTPAFKRLDGRGAARRSPADEAVPEIGDEVAAARALRRLADRLLGVASDDIAAIEGHPVHLST